MNIEATYDKVNGPLMLTWTIAKQFSRLAAENGRDRAELYLEKALENLVKGNLDKFCAAEASAYADGWRKGAEAMREADISAVMKNGLVSAAEVIRTLALPEPPATDGAP